MVKFKYHDGFVIECAEAVADILTKLRRGEVMRETPKAAPAPAPAPAPAEAVEKPARTGKKAAQKSAEEFL